MNSRICKVRINPEGFFVDLVVTDKEVKFIEKYVDLADRRYPDDLHVIEFKCDKEDVEYLKNKAFSLLIQEMQDEYESLWYDAYG